MANAKGHLGKSEISCGELASLIKGLMKLKSFVAEEYLTMMHVKLIELMADEAKIDFENFRMLLGWIIENEKRHEQILRMIENVLAEGKINQPVFQLLPLFNFAVNRFKNWVRLNIFRVQAFNSSNFSYSVF